MNGQHPPNIETLSYPSPLFVPAYFLVPYLVSESGPLHKNVLNPFQPVVDQSTALDCVEQ